MVKAITSDDWICVVCIQLYRRTVFSDTKQDPSSQTLTETIAVAWKLQQHTIDNDDRNVELNANRAPTADTDKRYHLGTDGTANDDNASGIERAAPSSPTLNDITAVARQTTVLQQHPSSPTLNDTTVVALQTTAAPVFSDTKQDPSSQLRETTAVARKTTAARDR
eukprot:CAMPEP_0168286600 /NCGR_PEP_ID=MMETSP0142_2-20121227/1364_1 /TAXON_ID=44445 /ORGANISM="Pseudo-nitzschia australis, Strain 10249 10 AB" /LENGTH=165 /DNA_ID=CAMNT_0008231447 /DNA_START=167 /DNA_END=660 /DNA_ORIENTATION=+